MKDEIIIGPSSPRIANKLLIDLAKPHGRRILLLCGLAVAQAILVAAPPWLVSIAIDNGIGAARQADYLPVFGVGASITACALGSTFLTRFWQMQAGEVGQLVVRELRQRLFLKLQKLHVAFHERLSSGQVIARLTSDTESVNTLFGTTLAELLQAALTIVVTTVAMLLLDAPLAALTFATLIPLGLLTIWCVRRLRRAFGENRAAIAETTVHVVESLNGIRTVQGFRSETSNGAEFSALMGRVQSSGREIQAIRGIYWPLVELLFSLAAVSVLLIGGFRVMEGELPIGVLAAFVLYVGQFFQPLLGLTASLDVLQQALTALSKIGDVMEAPIDVIEPAHTTAMTPTRRGEVRFEQVKFSYEQQPARSPSTPEIARLELTLSAGQTVALLGATGAGKSTLAKLIARFYDPSQGRILLDGIDLRDIPEQNLRQAVVMLTQESFLFSGTVADNIRVSRPSASMQDVEAAAKAMGADQFIQSLPQGYQTDVRKRGARLSAGQRQIISLSRAFLADPAILILDEATAALDIPTERSMQSALRTLLRGRTALIIAHRLSTVLIADRVLVLRDGEVIDDGAPDELLEKGTGEFAALHRDGHGYSMRNE